MSIEELYEIYLKHPSVSTDTRKITKDCLFFALKGDNFDGNAFAEKALDAGAAFAIIDNPTFKKSEKYLLFDDSLQILQQLASYHRKQLAIPVVGITGTNGKTTSKELINSVLSQKFKTFATQGNLNNHIGVPLTLLSIDSSIELAIVEMGANHQKEIGFLSSISQPTHGLITNVGKAHLEGFGGFEGVKKGKGELYDYLKEQNAIAFINRDSNHLMEMSLSRQLQQVIYFGSGSDCSVCGRIIKNDPFLSVEWETKSEKHQIQSNLTGAYNLENILAAITIGLHFGLAPGLINEGIASYVPGNNRSQVTRTATNTLICDFYNANPSSMSVALDNFDGISAARKVLILGDMFELGTEAAEEHQFILEKALKTEADERIFIGKEFLSLKNTQNAHFFESTAEALTFTKEADFKNATILIKGSRGMKLEQLLEVL
ncbi:UDP-N-acetylmuramoyl-tripeptide--D-alanyl-D-alanine ligase [Pedobacter sp. SYSU D00535]|uniref:UDP-N-acetylmuramoyl-tripeptide--D-alanyl-D- alanine ligase n=1 Tax=Pedobacter sp. SYSU D00535 TaxID=2810308 RepID=UPI001A965C91|nr:UDP-N-acetylmuramoyl-tripeptide--D-alanyl-D-alanine ligase [Pedobacter sp. SYSU D00535]